MGFPCSGRFPRHTCRRQYPGGIDGALSLCSPPPTAAFPVRQAGRLPRYLFRGLLGVHSRYGLHACWVALRNPSSSECFSEIRYLLSPPRLLPAGATSCRVGLSPTGNRRLCTAHRIGRTSWRFDVTPCADQEVIIECRAWVGIGRSVLNLCSDCQGSADCTPFDLVSGGSACERLSIGTPKMAPLVSPTAMGGLALALAALGGFAVRRKRART